MRKNLLRLLTLATLIGTCGLGFNSRGAGLVMAWGAGKFVASPFDSFDLGQSIVPGDLTTNAVFIAGGQWHSSALRADGTIENWGADTFGVVSNAALLSNEVAVAAGGLHELALNSDTTVTCWGYDQYGQAETPPGLSNVVAIACGFYHSMALKSDGTVAAWGTSTNPADFGKDQTSYGQAIVPTN